MRQAGEVGISFFEEIFLSLFVLRERACAHASGGGAEREERESQLGSAEPLPGLDPTSHEIMT